jgi:hypothetical protein
MWEQRIFRSLRGVAKIRASKRQGVGCGRKRPSFGQDRKARAAIELRPNLNPVPQQVDRAPHHEQPKTQAIGPCRIETVKRVEHLGQMIRRNADARIVNVDPDVEASMAASNQNSPAWRRVFDGVADEIMHNAVQEERIARDYGAGRAKAEAETLLPRSILVISAEPGEQRTKLNPHRLDAFRPLVQAKRIDKMVELLGQSRNRALAAVQILPLGAGFETTHEPFIDAHDHLQGLPQVVTGHREQHGVEVAGAPQLLLAMPAVAWKVLLGFAHDKHPITQIETYPRIATKTDIVESFIARCVDCRQLSPGNALLSHFFEIHSTTPQTARS